MSDVLFEILKSVAALLAIAAMLSLIVLMISLTAFCVFGVLNLAKSLLAMRKLEHDIINSAYKERD